VATAANSAGVVHHLSQWQASRDEAVAQSRYAGPVSRRRCEHRSGPPGAVTCSAIVAAPANKGLPYFKPARCSSPALGALRVAMGRVRSR
jgi:hypothetical protein